MCSTTLSELFPCKNYYLMRFTFEPETAKIPDDNRSKMIYNLLNQLCQAHPGNELFSLDEKGYLIIQNAEKNDFLCRQISAAMKQYANATLQTFRHKSPDEGLFSV